MAIPQVLLGHSARVGLTQGFDTLARLLAVTLGPTQRTVMSTSYHGALPEVLGDAATIARRFLALPDPAENVGAMMLRNLVWRQHERCGDGGATAAVLAQAMLRQAQRYVAAGFDTAGLRNGIERAAIIACCALQQAARLPDGEDDLQRVALAICGEPRMSQLLAELFTLLGADGSVVVEKYTAPYLEREYRAGGRWNARLASPYLASETTGEILVGPARAVLHDCFVALFAGSVTSLTDVQPLLELVARSDRPRLLLVAQDFADPALTTLVVNHQRGLLQVAAVELREPGVHRDQDFEDLAVRTGARLLIPARGDRLRDLSLEELGTALRVDTTDRDLGVLATPDCATVCMQHDALHSRLNLTEDEPERAYLRARIGRMAQGTALLKVGAGNESESDLLRRRAEQCIRALPLALRSGVVPGGGAAFLAAADALPISSRQSAENAGVAIVRQALDAPFRQIVANAGRRDPAAVLAEVRHRGAGWGYDALTDTIAPVGEAGLLDPVGVLCHALQGAASSAVMALTTEALILKRDPETSYTP